MLMTVCRKSLSPATLGEKREMFRCRSWRMASSNACLQYVHAHMHTGGRGADQAAKRGEGGERDDDADTETDTKPLVSSRQ